MKYARIVNGFAVDVRTESPEGHYTPNIVAEFVTVPDEVEDHWVYADGAWSAPPPPPAPPAPTPAPKPTLTPVQFKLCFTSAERIAIKAERANDPVLDDGYEILDDPRLTGVDLNLASVQGLIDYMVVKGLLTAERAAQVKDGVLL